MPEETTTQTEAIGTPEPVEQAAPEKSSADDMESMLARIPGLSTYFGDEAAAEKEKPAEEGAPSSDEPATESAGDAEPEIPSPEGEEKQEEEKKREELPPSVQKRIDKLVAQKHAAAEKAEALEAKVRELEAKTSAPPPIATTTENPLANINSPEELNRQFQDARAVKNWALENLDGGEVTGKDGTTEYWDGQKVKRYLAWTERLITEHIPNRHAYLENRRVADAEVKKAYPKMGAEEQRQIESWLKVFPEVQKFPDWKLVVMDYFTGLKLRESRAKQANGQKAVRNTPTLAAPSPSSGTKTPQKSVLNSDLLKRIATDRTALDVFSESLISGGS